MHDSSYSPMTLLSIQTFSHSKFDIISFFISKGVLKKKEIKENINQTAFIVPISLQKGTVVVCLIKYSLPERV